MASKDKDTLPKSQTTTSATAPTRGLASIATSAASEAGKSTDVVQKAQVSPDATKGKSTKDSPPSKERSSPQYMPILRTTLTVQILLWTL